MKIVKQDAELVWATPEPEKMIERIARVCYKSEHKISDSSYIEFIRMLRRRNHMAMFEHATISIHIQTNRGISHELVRHRLCAYAQESTRYCNYRDIGMLFIEPLNYIGNENYYNDFYRDIEADYNMMIGLDTPAQIARGLLPNDLKTEIVCTTNLREWLHIFEMRLHKFAHPQMRELMKLILPICKNVAPIVFEDVRI